jgi:hypothetical protein
VCVTAVLAAVSLAASAVGTGASIMSANAEKANAKYKARMEQMQIRRQQDAARTQAEIQEQGRVSEFARIRSNAMASLGASGLGESMSFTQGIDPESERALRQDIGAVRLNLLGEQRSLADQIQVSEYGSRIASFNASMSKVDAVAGFMKDAMSVGSAYNKSTVGTGGGSAAVRTDSLYNRIN